MIIDTSVMVSAVERHSPAAIDLLERLEEPSLQSMVVLAELESGVLTVDDDPEILRTRQRTLAAYRLASEPGTPPPPDLLARRFAEVTAAARRAGMRIGQNDRWILAESLHHDVPVSTADTTMHELGVALRGESASTLVGD